MVTGRLNWSMANMRGVAERHQRAALRDEIAQRLRAGLADAAGVLAGHRAGRMPSMIWRVPISANHDGVVTGRAGGPSCTSALCSTRERKVELLQDPARPALIDIAAPRFVERRCAASSPATRPGASFSDVASTPFFCRIAAALPLA